MACARCLLDATLNDLADLVRTLEADRYHGRDAARLTELFAWGERLCATAKALTARRAADTGAWKPAGHRSAADWLARTAGQTTAQAAGTLHAARQLHTQPDIQAAARAGRLSEQQTTAVTAAAAPHHHELLERARTDTLTALRHHSNHLAAAADDDHARYRAIHHSRYLRTWTDSDGAGRLSGRFTPDNLAILLACLTPSSTTPTARLAPTTPTSRPNATADALIAMAQAATTAAATTSPGSLFDLGDDSLPP